MRTVILLMTFIVATTLAFRADIVLAVAPSQETFEGVVQSILEEQTKEESGQKWNYQKLRIYITKGSVKNTYIVVENGLEPSAGIQRYSLEDKVILMRSTSPEGNQVFYIVDYVRRDSLLLLFIIFVITVVVVGRKWGALSLLGMAFSFVVIFVFILPQIISGKDPVLISVIGSSIIIPVTFSLSHGFKLKTLIASFGTIVSLLITGFISVSFVNSAHITGFATEEAGFLKVMLGDLVNMKQIFLAGMIIASLGILDDITISQASIVEELKSSNPNLLFSDLFNRAMNVGRDHIASLVNTLVLVYTGAALPLLLIFINNPRPFSELVNYEVIAGEIIQILIGSIGLILAVPITTFIAAAYFSKPQK